MFCLFLAAGYVESREMLISFILYCLVPAHFSVLIYMHYAHRHADNHNNNSIDAVENINNSIKLKSLYAIIC